jgi:ketosteroid isomerase-like protein
MSSTLDLVRSIFAAWERGDFRSVEWADPAIEYVIIGGPEPGNWNGVPEMERAWRSVLSAWEDFRAEALDYQELDGDRVLVFVGRRMRGKASGVQLADTNEAGVFHISDGRVSRLVLYWDRDRALADLGLAPERGSP